MYPEVATAGSVPAQISADGSIRHVLYSLDRTLPRSAVVSEHIALMLAIMFATMPIQAVSHCQAVVSLVHKSTEQRLSYKVEMAGFAAQTNFNMVQHITRVKSHCSKEQARGLGQELHHRGNELADRMALRARPTHGKSKFEAYVLKQGIGTSLC